MLKENRIKTFSLKPNIYKGSIEYNTVSFLCCVFNTFRMTKLKSRFKTATSKVLHNHAKAIKQHFTNSNTKAGKTKELPITGQKNLTISSQTNVFMISSLVF